MKPRQPNERVAMVLSAVRVPTPADKFWKMREYVSLFVPLAGIRTLTAKNEYVVSALSSHGREGFLLLPICCSHSLSLVRLKSLLDVHCVTVEPKDEPKIEEKKIL